MKMNELTSISIALIFSHHCLSADEIGNQKPAAGCPTDIGKLSQAQRAALPSQCRTPPTFLQQNWPWIAGGAAALAVTIAVIANNNDDDSDAGSSSDNGGDNGGDNETPINYDNKVVADEPGEIGTYIQGDDYAITFNGGTDASNGSTASKIDGNSNIINNEGASTATGQGSIATDVTGNENTINNNGNSSVAEGATGTNVTGDDNTINNNGSSSITDGATGTDITGNNNTINNNGATDVSDGSTGTNVNGDSNSVINVGDLHVHSTDPTRPSLGLGIAGDSNEVNQIGTLEVIDFSTGLKTSGKENRVNLTSPTMSVTGYQSTGVDVQGEANAVTLTGNMVVDKDQASALAADYFYIPSTGIKVGGSNNSVVLDGHLQVIADTEDAGHQYSKKAGSQENINGAIISGNGNRVDFLKGIELVGEKDQMRDITAGDAIATARTGQGNTALIQVEGQSSIYLSGASRMSGEFPANSGPLITLSQGAHLEITDGATFDNRDAQITNYNFFMDPSNIISLSSGATAVTKGEVFIEDMIFIKLTDTDSAINNEGKVEINRTSKSREMKSGPFTALAARKSSSAVNEGTLTGKVMNQNSIINLYQEYSTTNDFSANSSVASIELMAAVGTSASIINNAQGTLEMYGRGVAMEAGDTGQAENYGVINADAMWKNPNDQTELSPDIPSNLDRSFAIGMNAGLDNYAGTASGAVAINRQGGTITINNAGAGMVAYGTTNQVINQGTINLAKNENYTGNEPLSGMAAYGGGTAINDTTGIININAENGVAFFSDGNVNNRIINRGQITLGAGVPATADNSGSVTTPEFTDGTTLSGVTTLAESTVILEGSTVSNTGTVNGSGTLLVDGTLTNQSGAVIDAPVNTTGTLNNAGTLNGGSYGASTLSFTGGTLNNSGTVNGNIRTSGSSNLVNTGTLTKGADLYGSSTLTNQGSMVADPTAGSVKDKGLTYIRDTSLFLNDTSGTFTQNTANAIYIGTRGTLVNHGTLTLTNGNNGGAVNLNSAGVIINNGTANVSKVTFVNSRNGQTAADVTGWFWNQPQGAVNFAATGTGNHKIAVNFSDGSKNMKALNEGTITLSGNGAIGMRGSQNAQLVNNGTLNLGSEGSTETGMIAMQLDAGATADAVLENNGTINIHAGNSYAFSRLGANGRLVNNGTVNLTGAGSGLVKEAGVGVAGVNGNTGDNTEVHYASYTLPVDPTAPVALSQYTVGTRADGSAGTLAANRAVIQDVTVDTGFTAGTAAKTQTFDNVFVGRDIQGEQNITSASVVWSAAAQKDAGGNVDVTMTKNAYAQVVTDAGVSSMAKALDAAYTNNALFNSLNVKSAAELNSAMKQLSGSQAQRVARDARVLSTRFDMLADAAPVSANGLAFNAVARGDQRAELGNDTTYDMLALRQHLSFAGNQTLALAYGIARLDGNGSNRPGDNGITGGYSQFFGLAHTLPLTDSGLNWTNALRYDLHNLSSNRTVRYGDINKVASADSRQQYLELRSTGEKTYTVQEGLTVTPFAGLKMRYTTGSGYREQGAGDVNLTMGRGSETAVDSVIGMTLGYAGKNGWAVKASLEGGPNLSYNKSRRTASLQGMNGQTFTVEDGQQGGGLNGLAQAGVSYTRENTQLGIDAYSWREDGISDRGLMLNFKRMF